MADSLEDILGRILDRATGDLWTALPARVVAYEAESQRVQVQPAPADEDGALPVLPGVPVVFPGGAGAAVVWPIKAGDTGLVVFCSRSIQRWLASADEGDPQSTRHHHLGDAVFLPGLRTAGGVLTSVSATNLEVREPTGGGILVGQGATLAAARTGDAVTVSNAAWLMWFNAIGTVLGVPPPPSAPTGTITGGSAVVKVK